MKINQLKINSYGKLKDKEINIDNGINLIYGQNESGKSTLINFIINSFYGISKNKKGKEVSNYDKYQPWVGEEFSGRIKYELDNGEIYEVFRDFRKKNPKIFNSNMEDISKEFNIDKNKGNEFFYEQTKIDEELFLSTLAINQSEVKLENQAQNMLIQKIANLAQTGDDSTSFKRVIDRINRRQLDEVGTDRTREKPINIVKKRLQELEKEKQDLEQYKNFKYKYEEDEKLINDEISILEKQGNILQDIKIYKESQKIENEKLNIKEDIKKHNLEKINLLNTQINDVKNNFKNSKENNLKQNKNNKKLNIIFLFLILINILQFIFVQNKYFKYIFLLTIPMYLAFYLISIINKNKKIKKEEKINKNNSNKLNSQLINLENEKKILEENQENLQNELDKIKKDLDIKKDLENQKIKNNYENKIDNSKISYYLNLNDLNTINYEIGKNNKEINDKKLKLHTLDLDKRNIEPQLDNLSKIEEELVNYSNKMRDIENLNFSMNLAKDVLEEVYEKMKNSVTPKFTENLSMNISKITDGKYNKAMFNENDGLILELENGDYVPVNRLSIGTIDQLYLSLRLSMIDDLSEEIIPILLDEAFAFYDDNRLKNILMYLSNQFKNRQIIIFSCTGREKNILNQIGTNYNYIEL